jgi:thiamine pyrophosphokinase
MNAIIVGASPLAHTAAWYRKFVKAADVVVACDAAGEWCVGLGRLPDLAVGDFDSASPGAAERLRALGVEVSEYPTRKNASDLDLAVDAALALGAGTLTVTAAFTNRLDHTLAALGLALRVPANVPLVFADPGLAARVVRPPNETHVELEVQPGALVSVVALAAAEGVTLSGLAYPLLNASLEALSSLGVSNVATDSRVTVDVVQGTLLVMCVDETAHGIQVPR